jgi:hypothetical protein
MKRLSVILVVLAVLSGGCERTVNNNYEVKNSKYYQMKEILDANSDLEYYSYKVLEYLKWGFSRVEEYIPGIILLGTLYHVRRLFSEGINLRLDAPTLNVNVIKRSGRARAVEQPAVEQPAEEHIDD